MRNYLSAIFGLCALVTTPTSLHAETSSLSDDKIYLLCSNTNAQKYSLRTHKVGDKNIPYTGAMYESDFNRYGLSYHESDTAIVAIIDFGAWLVKDTLFKPERWNPCPRAFDS